MIDVEALTTPGLHYPIAVELSLYDSETDTAHEPEFGLSLEEARLLSQKLLAAVHEVEDAARHYVQVRFPASTRRYTYIDPSGTLEVGDKVLVPPTAFDGNSSLAYLSSSTAVVVALGKGPDYEGPYKTIRSKLVDL